MLRAPSNQKPYDTYWSGDPAFVQLGESPTDEAKKEHERVWDLARDTGDFSAVLADKRTLADATKYVMRLVPGHALRKLIDLKSEGKIGNAESSALAFRIALVDVVNFPGLTVKPEPHEDPAFASLGKMLTVDAANQVDAEDIRIIGELGALAYVKALGVRPLSSKG